jgi:queuine/archaeosine tRNA-ribosyltransferase
MQCDCRHLHLFFFLFQCIAQYPACIAIIVKSPSVIPLREISICGLKCLKSFFYPQSLARMCLANSPAATHRHPAPSMGKSHPKNITLGVRMGYEMSTAENTPSGEPS